jgi:hypothetical protein
MLRGFQIPWQQSCSCNMLLLLLLLQCNELLILEVSLYYFMLSLLLLHDSIFCSICQLGSF